MILYSSHGIFNQYHGFKHCGSFLGKLLVPTAMRPHGLLMISLGQVEDFSVGELMSQGDIILRDSHICGQMSSTSWLRM